MPVRHLWCSMPYEPELRYSVCGKCGFVRRSWWANPLISNGRKPKARR